MAGTQPSSDGRPALACVVPATDSPATLDRCLAAIRSAADPPEQLILVTDPPGAGPAEARNRGAADADGAVLVFVDSDVVVHADAFVRIREAFASDPGLVAVFGSYDDAPEAPGAVSGFRNLLHHHVHQRGAGPADTFWAGLGAVGREPFAHAGGFDAERYPAPSIEDIELGMRLSAAGGRIRLDPAIQGTHLKSWSLSTMIRTDYASRGLPWSRLLLSSGSPSSSLNLGWRHRASALASAAVAAGLVLRRPRLLVAALASLLVLNGPFYALLWRRRGPPQAAAGVGLHVLHHLTGLAAAASAVLEAARDQARGSRKS